MEELISRVVQSVGIDEATAKPAIGVILNALKSILPDGTAAQLMSSFGGAEALMNQASEAGSGGIGGMLGGAMSSLTGGSAGAVTEAFAKLQSLGLDTDQAKGVANEVVSFAKAKAPADVASVLDDNLSGLLG